MARGQLVQGEEEPANVVSITDTGSGVPPEALPHVFEPFFTTKEPGRGTGLGLAQVHGFATSSGGSAEIASAPGRGTTVILRLREEHAARTHAAPTAAPAPDAFPPGGRLLLIEDNAAIRAATSEYLANAGWCVTEAPDATRGLELLETEPFDIVVSDVVMPGALDGVALAQEIRRRWAQTLILLVSGYSASAHGARDLDVEVLTKPYEFASLEVAIRRARHRSEAAQVNVTVQTG